MISAGIMDEKEFEKLISKNKINIIDFSAVWCGPCRMMAPIVEASSERHKGEYSYINIDVDSAGDIAIKYNIQVVPTFVVLIDGKEISRTSGYMELQDFENFIKNAIN